ncbi:MAG: hypothetical protein KatS3mg081_2432 [Gemmatimonadales bacterium]|nr:hypothetical protein HRbin33_01492 [bacterium HR33]GIW53077.1 MAG: hypothetical protein KatS3mg081_2432 [Gemmatimonadales bacterium]
MAVRRILLALFFTPFMGGCALLPGRANLDEPVQEERSRYLTVEVDNQNFYDATIYAVRPGLRLRIGRVVGFNKETFEFAWPDLDLRFEIALLSVGSYYTWSLPVERGDQLALTILPDLHLKRPGTVFF